MPFFEVVIALVGALWAIEIVGAGGVLAWQIVRKNDVHSARQAAELGRAD